MACCNYGSAKEEMGIAQSELEHNDQLLCHNAAGVVTGEYLPAAVAWALLESLRMEDDDAS